MVLCSFDRAFSLPYDLIVDANGINDQATCIVPLLDA